MDVIKWLLIGLLACLTVRQQAIWAHDLALWRQAVWVAPHAPRAAMNLSLAYRLAGDMPSAIDWLAKADSLLPGHPREGEYRQRIRVYVQGMDAFGIPVCDSSRLSRYC